MSLRFRVHSNELNLVTASQTESNGKAKCLNGTALLPHDGDIFCMATKVVPAE